MITFIELRSAALTRCEYFSLCADGLIFYLSPCADAGKKLFPAPCADAKEPLCAVVLPGIQHTFHTGLFTYSPSCSSKNEVSDSY